MSTCLLCIERLTYGFLWQKPNKFSHIASIMGYKQREPEFIFNLVKLFKAIQVYVFMSWYYFRYVKDSDRQEVSLTDQDDEAGFMNGLNQILPDFDAVQMIVGLLLLVFGQFLNYMVWYRIGVNGVCYGVKFGRNVPWCTEFPFNTFNHPQYIGSILTVWGMFVFCWKDQPDWYMLPLIETTLYLCSIYFWEV